MPDLTVRYYAASRLAYAQALDALVTYARDHGEDFAFGPLDLAALEHQGLTVTGPDLAGVRAVLAGIPGLEEET